MAELFLRKALIELNNSDERVGIVSNIVPSPVNSNLVMFTGSH